MKFTDRPKWKIVLLTAICLIGLLAAVGGSFAAYTSQAYKRGVVRNRDNETVRFTSNYLQACASNTSPDNYAERTILYSENDKNATSLNVDLWLYNYANGNINLVSQKDITYDLTITFKYGDENENAYAVSADSETMFTKTKTESDGSITYKASDQTLIGRSAKSHKYTISFPGSDIDKLRIVVVATPTNLSVTNNQQLAAVIAPYTGSETKTFSFKNDFIDDKKQLPTAYDGFNYEVSISNGVADATISWDSSLLEIDPFFLQKIGKTSTDITPGENNQKTLSFEMDQSNGTGDYLIPFYIVNKQSIPSKWDGMNSKITFNAVLREQISDGAGDLSGSN